MFIIVTRRIVEVVKLIIRSDVENYVNTNQGSLIHNFDIERFCRLKYYLRVRTHGATINKNTPVATSMGLYAIAITKITIRTITTTTTSHNILHFRPAKFALYISKAHFCCLQLFLI